MALWRFAVGDDSFAGINPDRQDNNPETDFSKAEFELAKQWRAVL